MFQKKTYKKRLPSKASRGKFSTKTITRILERDNHECVVCSAPPVDIHHVKYKSSGGRNVFTNGVSLCREHHNLAHSSNEERKRLENMMIDLYGVDYYKDGHDME